jgi:hypothetical protein
MTFAMTLPLMCFGQERTEQQPQQAQPQQVQPQQPVQTQAVQEQPKAADTTAPAAQAPAATAPATATKGKHARTAEEQTNPQTKTEVDTNVRGKTDVHGRGERGERNEREGERDRSKATQHTQVNRQEFKSRHREVFTLGRHPKEFFVQRFGENHFHLIGNTYFVFVDTCWVAVDVDGFTYAERIICPGDPEFIEVD